MSITRNLEFVSRQYLMNVIGVTLRLNPERLANFIKVEKAIEVRNKLITMRVWPVVPSSSFYECIKRNSLREVWE